MAVESVLQLPTANCQPQSALRDFAHRDRDVHGRVLLVIAHRIDTIMDTDQLLVLAAGRLVESGPPEELARGDGVFAKMAAAARIGKPTQPQTLQAQELQERATTAAEAPAGEEVKEKGSE